MNKEMIDDIVEQERIVIGAVVNSPELFDEVELTPLDFFSTENKIHWQCVESMIAGGEHLNVFSCKEKFQVETGTSGQDCFMDMSHRALGHTDLQVKQYAYRIKKQSHITKAMQIFSNSIDMLNDGNLDGIDNAVSKLMDINRKEADYDHSFGDVACAVVDEAEKAMSEDGAAMTTGYKQLDDAMGGFFDSDLIIIPARPAMGKTACLLNIILRCGGTPGVISAEQGHDQMGIRTVCIGGKINHHKFRTGQLEEEDWNSMTASIMKFKERNGRIYDKPAPTILEIEKIARRWVYKNGVDILFIDYAQRISHEDKRMPRWQQNTDIAMRLKELARTLNIPVVALAQVNRDCEKRPDKRPEMGDIADASAYEKEADAIITLYRDEVYNEDTPDRGVLEMDFKKNRHGPTGVIRMKWEGQYMRVDDFTNYEQRQPEPIAYQSDGFLPQ